MSFPIEFVKKTGDYDFFSPIINFTGNAAVVAVGGSGLGGISYLALKTLGFSNIATTTATAIPVVIGAAGLVGTIVGGGIFLTMVKRAGDDLRRR